MCGIVGIVKFDTPCLKGDLETVLSTIRHRGPDDVGYFVHENVALGHRRLSIIDLESGAQPMGNVDGTLWITYNGEIYNYRELRHELESLGVVFTTRSDTEVLLHGYRAWGRDLLQRLRGMFAFAIADTVNKQIFLARDHFGIKPLVYYQDGDTFAFASEIQALRRIPGFKADIDITALDQYLAFKYITAPATAFLRVRKLPPAHYMLLGFDGQIREITRYWRMVFSPDYSLTEGEWLERLDACLRDSVKAHLVSDVPFGAFLSGGVDSSLVVSYMAQEMGRPVKTFTIGFEEDSYNEMPYARRVAQRWHTEHHEEIVRAAGLDLLQDLVRHYGEPFGDTSAIPTWYVSRLARQHVTMVLGGDAGDELFAGYEVYTNQWARQVAPIPHHLSQLKKVLYPWVSKLLPVKYPLRRADFVSWLRFNSVSPDGPSPLWNKDLAATITNERSRRFEESFATFGHGSHFQRAQGVDFEHYLPADILTKVDIASMMHSVEVRTPLLDKEVVELAARIPESLNICKEQGAYSGKRLLKKLLLRHFPSSFVNRPKQGFAIPINLWLGDGGGSQDIGDRLNDLRSPLYEYFAADEIAKVLVSSRKEMTWKLLFMDEWLRQIGSE